MNSIITQINQQLTIHGYQISKEDFNKLKQELHHAVLHFNWVESDLSILNKIITKFSESSYLNQNNYLFLLQGIIFCYYGIRSHLSSSYSDEIILTELFNQFNSHGELNTELAYTTIQSLKRR